MTSRDVQPDNFTDGLFAQALAADDDVSKTIIDHHSPGRIYEQPGQVIGRYTLVEVLGEGGFGSVWRAEQSEPVARQVALKIIKLGMDTREVIARFEQERQALAIMDHPNIARVFDAGVTDAGRPYFVMELVKGEPLTTYCDRNRLTIRQRLELFIQVCQAIQHAHQKGVIHRDLKPSNILVAEHDGAPVVRVIDFGVAKATERSLTAETLQTLAGQVIGTPGYMSPEQADPLHQDIDTRSDVYSLGAVLYELLTSTLPLDDTGCGHVALEAMLRHIREQDPLRPSSRITSLAADKQATAAKRRGLETTRLPHAVRGDLDWIVMKCLEKDRQRRYETVSGLAADVQRHLNDEPITARPPSAAYVAGRTIRRHKVAFAAAALILLTLITGIITSTAFYLRAETRRKEAQQARSEQELLKSEATNAAAKYRLSSTTADYELATRSLTAKSDFEALKDLARALETDASNHSAVALALHTMMSRPRVLMRRADEPKEPTDYHKLLYAGIFKNWQPCDLMAREFVRMLKDPLRAESARPHLEKWQNVVLPTDRLVRIKDYPDPYQFHTNDSWRGWHGHVASPECLNDFDIHCGFSADQRHAIVVDRQGRYAVYRRGKVPAFVREGVLRDWPVADFKFSESRSLDPHLFMDAACEWLAVGSYDIKTGARNPACGLWRLSSGARVVNTQEAPVTGIDGAGFHPSGCLAAFATFGRQTLFVDLATSQILPFKKEHPGDIHLARFPLDGLRMTTGGYEFISMCEDHSVVPIHNVGWLTGEEFEQGLLYLVPSDVTNKFGSSRELCRNAKPSVFCGGVLPLVLHSNVSPACIQWDSTGEVIVWCEGGKSFMKVKLHEIAQPSSAERLHQNAAAPVKDFKLCQQKNRLIYTSSAGVHIVGLAADLSAVSDSWLLPAPDLGRLALNPALDQGCVVQRVSGVDCLRRFTISKPDLNPGTVAVWNTRQVGTDAIIRDYEFSPDGSRLAVSGSGAPSFQLFSAAFLATTTQENFQLWGTSLESFLGGDVAWSSSGNLLGRGSSGSGCHVFRITDAPDSIAKTMPSYEGSADTGVCHRMAFIPGTGRYVLSGNNDSKTVRLMDRELKEVIAEWPFTNSIDVIEVSPNAECFGVITGKRLEVYWLPPLNEDAPTWFPKFLRLLANTPKNTAEAVEILEEVEAAISRGEGQQTSPRLFEAVQWTLADPATRAVFPGLRLKMSDYLDELVQNANPEWSQRALSTAVLQNVRSAAIYRAAAKHPPAGLAAMSQNQWRSYYDTLADDFKRPTTIVPAPLSRASPLRPLPSPPDQHSARWQAALAMTYLSLSDALRGSRKLDEAIQATREAEIVCRRLVAQQPENTERLFLLTSIPYRLGMIYFAQKKYPEARTAFEQWVTDNLHLLAKEPKNKTWLEELGNSYSSLGSVALELADLPAAETAWRGKVQAFAKLSALDPETALWQTNLADAENLLGITLRDEGKLADAVAHFTSSLALLERLRSQDRLTGDPAHWPDRVKGNLKETEQRLAQEASKQTK